MRLFSLKVILSSLAGQPLPAVLGLATQSSAALPLGCLGPGAAVRGTQNDTTRGFTRQKRAAVLKSRQASLCFVSCTQWHHNVYRASFRIDPPSALKDCREFALEVRLGAVKLGGVGFGVRLAHALESGRGGRGVCRSQQLGTAPARAPLRRRCRCPSTRTVWTSAARHAALPAAHTLDAPHSLPPTHLTSSSSHGEDAGEEHLNPALSSFERSNLPRGARAGLALRLAGAYPPLQGRAGIAEQAGPGGRPVRCRPAAVQERLPRPVPSSFRVLACARALLNATGQSRVMLSPRQERLSAARGLRQEERGLKSARQRSSQAGCGWASAARPRASRGGAGRTAAWAGPQRSSARTAARRSAAACWCM